MTWHSSTYSKVDIIGRTLESLESIVVFNSKSSESSLSKIFQNYQNLVQEIMSGLGDPITTLILFLLFIFWGFFCSYVATYFKMRRNFQTGYTRKIFHFLVFTSAAAINYIWGFSGVCLFGIVISTFIFFAVYQQESSNLYKSLAREKDVPHQTLYILIPYFSTLFGGLSINLFFPEYVALGYLICGIADASGEVVGTKFGKHSFTVKTIGKHMPEKSIEGSASVFVLTFIIYILFAYSELKTFTPEMFFLLFICSLIITVLEIYTTKGFDNFTIQVLSIWFYAILI